MPKGGDVVGWDAAIGEAEVKNHEVYWLLQRDELGDGAGRCDHFNIAQFGKELPEPLRDNRVIVNECNLSYRHAFPPKQLMNVPDAP